MMSTVIFCIVMAFVFGFLFGAVYGTQRCTKILLSSPKVREILGEEQWQGFMRRSK